MAMEPSQIPEDSAPVDKAVFYAVGMPEGFFKGGWKMVEGKQPLVVDD